MRTYGPTDRQTDRQTDRETDRETDRRTDMTKLTVGFRKFLAPLIITISFLNLLLVNIKVKLNPEHASRSIAVLFL
jgi:hypothetical protein